MGATNTTINAATCFAVTTGTAAPTPPVSRPAWRYTLHPPSPEALNHSRAQQSQCPRAGSPHRVFFQVMPWTLATGRENPGTRAHNPGPIGLYPRYGPSAPEPPGEAEEKAPVSNGPSLNQWSNSTAADVDPFNRAALYARHATNSQLPLSAKPMQFDGALKPNRGNQVNPVPDALSRSGTSRLVTIGSAHPHCKETRAAPIAWLDTIRQGMFARDGDSVARRHRCEPCSRVAFDTGESCGTLDSYGRRVRD
ncbi:hypothetical protein Purlil1_12970 [Purpureocillium lilacinum]|uniref:Uncharacterized protein n=1 Tax=Purpureocillium lilacinum TaxID=33203 RepID=A0ABR0BFD5_PURLI|nr:hypothetical protein Purlil1_12970 [Purpureocillium lilacinum]